MLKFAIPTGSHRKHSPLLVLSMVCFLIWAAHAQAQRFKPRGVSIPDAPELFVQGATRLDRSESGADLTLPLDADEAWQLLNRVLAGLDIKPREQDTQSRRLVTGWVLWVWDPDLEIGRSKPTLKALSRTYERHRFEFSVEPEAANGGARIHISDSARQKEIDITPDSEYAWMEWRDDALQADAAWSFMRRLQGNFEAALSSRLVPSMMTAPRIVEPLPPEATGQVAPAPEAVIVEPVKGVPTPVPPAPARPQGAVPTDAKPPVAESRPPATSLPAEVEKQPLPASPVTAARPVEMAPDKAVKPQPATDLPPGGGASTPPAAAAPLAVQGGLLVDAGPDTTWQALLRAIDALGIGLQSRDQAQHMLSTQWISAMYDNKTQQLTLQSNAQERWAFNVWGKGRQRHRFQLILIPVDGGARTMVYAYHTGFQVETDRTPDSSQTLLYWKDHKTESAIAMAFLRQLRLVVRE